jgi:formamidopyrimidine-DNA glycosylase
MPELPEVETIVRQLDAELSGKRLGQVRLSRKDIVHGDPRPLSRLLPDRRIEGVHRRAKRVIIDLRPRAQLVFHLGMSGRLTLCALDASVEKHTHLRIAIRNADRELRFRDPRRFGGVWCLTGGPKHKGRKLGEVGPEPLPLTLRQFKAVVARPRQLKALLLDQRVIAGLGNIYCDEALHAAGVHPLTRADSLDEAQARRLLRAIKATLRKAIRSGGSTFADYRRADGRAGSYQKHHRAYHRDGQPCRTCGTTIQRINVAGRSTFICPRCQQEVSKPPS